MEHNNPTINPKEKEELKNLIWNAQSLLGILTSEPKPVKEFISTMRTVQSSLETTISRITPKADNDE